MPAAPNADIDFPGIKATLWHEMHGDLRLLVPWFNDHHEFLWCPTCLRLMRFEELSLEHIIPQRAIADDPKAAREAVISNQRSGLTLLCTKQLIRNGKPIKGNGCNGWKGKFFDKAAHAAIHSEPTQPNTKISISRRMISMLAIGYLALFRKYGYRVALASSGRLMRKQFFCPDSFLNEVPILSQAMPVGSPLTEFSEQTKLYWDDPFKITIKDGSAQFVIRNMTFHLPLSDDPTTPIARILPYVPLRYRWRPDLETAW
jgi:hypothetical protein